MQLTWIFKSILMMLVLCSMGVASVAPSGLNKKGGDSPSPGSLRSPGAIISNRFAVKNLFVDRNKQFHLNVPSTIKCTVDEKERTLCVGKIYNSDYSLGIFSQQIQQVSSSNPQLLLRTIGLNEHEKYAQKPHIQFLRLNGVESLSKNEYVEPLTIGGEKGIAQSFVYDSFAQTTLRKHVIRARVFYNNKLFSLSLKSTSRAYEKNARVFKELVSQFAFGVEQKKQEPSDFKKLLSELDFG